MKKKLGSDCNETSQEWSLGYVDVHLGFNIFKIATVAKVSMKVLKKIIISDCNEISQWSTLNVPGIVLYTMNTFLCPLEIQDQFPQEIYI